MRTKLFLVTVAAALLAATAALAGNPATATARSATRSSAS